MAMEMLAADIGRESAAVEYIRGGPGVGRMGKFKSCICESASTVSQGSARLARLVLTGVHRHPVDWPKVLADAC